MAVGHSHPAVVEAVERRMRLGSHFAQPTEDAIVVAEELARRFRLPLWRFTNSGTEATMDAIHLMQSITGRDLIVKIEGSYHGHHVAVMVSMYTTRSTSSVRPIDPAASPRVAAFRRRRSTSAWWCRSMTLSCSSAFCTSGAARSPG
ncbi:MAG: aminotransferase class III-fold pyridoxal phosphate-dependent enzyme [Acidimicrobiales bacterium]